MHICMSERLAVYSCDHVCVVTMSSYLDQNLLLVHGFDDLSHVGALFLEQL